MRQQTFPTRETLRRASFRLADVVVVTGTLALFVLISELARGALVPFNPPHIVPEPVNLDALSLVYYLLRSTLRMFVALIVSVIFTFGYGYVASHSAKAERLLIPLLDILQSVPVLGFLSLTITLFISLFRGSLVGLEAASIFAIFTGQAWNMAFSFYQSLRTIPKEQREFAQLYRLSRWQYFTKVEIPNSMIGLTWNAMMSFGGGWFFVAASEAISVLNEQYTLPGIGSYVTRAVNERNGAALLMAIVAMAAMIALVDQLVWRPLIAWSQKFRNEQTEAADVPQSWVLNLWKTARLPTLVGRVLSPLTEAINRVLNGTMWISKGRDANLHTGSSPWADRLYNSFLVAVVIASTGALLRFIFAEVGLAEVGTAFFLGLATLIRVIVLVAISSLIYIPVGVAIGFNPRLARIVQPLAQFLSSFPANFLFPFVTIVLIRTGISINFGSVLLMSLGAQWYVLFNVIAGAQNIPSDLREMATNMGLKGWPLWRKLIIPGVFPAWVTGSITASGGAWNASIVSEIVSWGDTTLSATGLGAYIAQVTTIGDWPRIALGVSMMSLFVVFINRLFWRRLYIVAERNYTL